MISREKLYQDGDVWWRRADCGSLVARRSTETNIYWDNMKACWQKTKRIDKPKIMPEKYGVLFPYLFVSKIILFGVASADYLGEREENSKRVDKKIP